jgi:phosphonatase-like hydrolase
LTLRRSAGNLRLAVLGLDVLIEDAASTQMSALSVAVEDAGARYDTEQLRAVVGLPSTCALATLLGGVCGARAKMIFDTTIAAHYAEVGAVRERDGASQALRSLRAQGLAIAISTCLSRATLEVVLRRTAWVDDGLLDTTVTAEEVGWARPCPDLVFEAMRRTTVVDVRRVIAAGTTPLALAEARVAGCGAVVGATYGSHGPEELRVHPETYLVQNVHELLDVVALQHVARRELPARTAARATLSFPRGVD